MALLFFMVCKYTDIFRFKYLATLVFSSCGGLCCPGIRVFSLRSKFAGDATRFRAAGGTSPDSTAFRPRKKGVIRGFTGLSKIVGKSFSQGVLSC